MTSRTEAAFGRGSTAAEVLEGVDVRGKVAVVTGASAGLGGEVARVLAERGAHVVGAARSRAGQDGPITVALDLSSLDSVRAAAGTITSRHPRIDLLFNNAGVMATPQGRTAEGFDLQLGVNHLGHFLLTALLTSSFTQDTRIVNTSSLGHAISGMRWEDPHFRSSPYEKWQAYGQSKTANVLFTKGLAERGFLAYAVHPGAIDTGLTRHLDGEELTFVQQASSGEAKTVAQGAATLLLAATAIGIPSGSYLSDCQVAEPSLHATGRAEAERLWSWSEEQVGTVFPSR